MKKWQVYPKIKDSFVAQNPEISPVLLQLLFNRGFEKKDDIKAFLGDILDQEKIMTIAGYTFYDPFLFQDMEKAVDLMIVHIKEGNKIVIYGDYDADGVTSSALLLEALKAMNVEVEVYLPDRINEGYGLNKPAIDRLVSDGFNLLITVDNGVRNKEEVAYAKSKGFDIIVTDHHILPEESELPECLLINPANKKDNYPWSFLAGVGVAFKLLTALLLKSTLSDEKKKEILEKSLDLVAIGTIADMVSLLGENRLLVKSGLKIINRNKRLGLNELIKVAKINVSRKIEAWNIGWQIGPRLNAASRMGDANNAFKLLVTSDRGEANKLAFDLNNTNVERQEVTRNITAQVEEGIDPHNIPSIIIGVANKDQDWSEGVIGLIAGRIAEKYYRPTLIITHTGDGESSYKGSGRSVEELNLIQAVESCSDSLEKYGGHPMACGFSLSGEDNLDKFKKQITEIADKKLKDVNLIPKLKIEAELDIKDVDLSLAEKVVSLSPFGQHNPQPSFVSYNVKIEDVMTMGFENQHIKLSFNGIWAIAFGKAEQYKDFKAGDQVDLVYYLEINEFNGRKDPQLKIVDIKKYE